MPGLNKWIQFIINFYKIYKLKINKKFYNYQNFAIYDFLFEVEVVQIDLQRFAAEDEGRTEEPTERRKREEREKGNVPRTGEIPSALILLGTVILLIFFSTYMFHQFIEIFRLYYMKIGEINYFEMSDLQNLILNLFYQTGKIVFPILIAGFLLAIIGNVVQFGFLFTLQPLAFKLERIIPDFKRILPTRRNIINLSKNILEILLILIITFYLIQSDLISMLKSAGTDLRQAILIFSIISAKVLIIGGVILLLFSILDYFYQRYEYIENLKMTISEVKQEVKEEVGDPLIRKRQRERAMEISRSRTALQKVKEADVVITNPTHYAVALLYNYPWDNAPRVLAKGKDHLALLMKNVAKENQIHIEENPVLARELYNNVEEGEEIPQAMYRAIILIYQKLEKFRNLVRR